MSFPFPSSHNSYACYLSLINQQKHTNNQDQNPPSSQSKFILYSLQNDYNYLTIWQIDYNVCHSDMLPYQFAYIVILICLLCHIELSTHAL
jgi:hypothetical protein